MSPAAQVVCAIMGPILIIVLLAFEPASVLIARWIEREQRRRDLVAGIQPPDDEGSV
jgi:hypothetical protein